jgi:nucleotide-binding universal stress UspA family protein
VHEEPNTAPTESCRNIKLVRPVRNAVSFLVPVDFSDRSRSAVETAGSLAKPLGAMVDVLCVRSMPLGDTILPPKSGTCHFADVVSGKPARGMDTVIIRLRQAGVRIHARIETGEFINTVLEIAKFEEYSLIVMGAPTRTDLLFPFMGKVARILRRASCPVLTVQSGSRQTLSTWE